MCLVQECKNAVRLVSCPCGSVSGQCSADLAHHPELMEGSGGGRGKYMGGPGGMPPGGGYPPQMGGGPQMGGQFGGGYMQGVMMCIALIVVIIH